MTTLTEFSALFGTLARQLRVLDLDEATILDYHRALRGYPLDALRMAQQAFAVESGRKWLPTSAEWAGRASACQLEALRQTLPPAREVLWSHECGDCWDTGWVQGLTCAGAEHGPCGRRRRHGAHAYVLACPCRPTNRTWRRHQQIGRSA